MNPSTNSVTWPTIVLDGGMGRELLRIGAPFRQPEWSALALLEGPEWVVTAHTNFIEAGADIITTNSYAIVPFHLGEEQFAREGLRLATLAGQLARQAVDQEAETHSAPSPVARPTVLVAGSLPPLFGSYLPELFVAADASRIIDPLVSGLAPYVDLWLGETLSCIGEAIAVCEALDRQAKEGGAPRKPLWLSFTLSDTVPGELRSGELVADAVRLAMERGAEAVLFNCSQVIAIDAALTIAIDEVSRDEREVRVGAYANRFVDSHSSEHVANESLAGLRSDLDPATYRDCVFNWIQSGASIVGGCCGITPDHIAEIRSSLRSTIGEGPGVN